MLNNPCFAITEKISYEGNIAKKQRCVLWEILHVSVIESVQVSSN